MLKHTATRIAIGVTVVALLAAACGGDDDTTTTSNDDVTATTVAPATTTAAPAATEVDSNAQPPIDYAGFRQQATACGAEAPPERVVMQFDEPDDLGLPAEPLIATIATSCGEIVVELDPAAAPATVNSFVFLAGEGYFDGTAAHRVAPGFVIQAGDPTATGSGGPGYFIADEYPADDFVYERGVLAMANAGPRTTGSQFFIMLGDAPLPPQFSVFGQVIEGDEVLDLIAALPLGLSRTGEQSTPLESIYLNSVTVEGAPSS